MGKSIGEAWAEAINKGIASNMPELRDDLRVLRDALSQPSTQATPPTIFQSDLDAVPQYVTIEGVNDGKPMRITNGTYVLKTDASPPVTYRIKLGGQVPWWRRLLRAIRWG